MTQKMSDEAVTHLAERFVAENGGAQGALEAVAREMQDIRKRFETEQADMERVLLALGRIIKDRGL